MGSHKPEAEKDLSKGNELNPHISRAGTLQGDGEKEKEKEKESERLPSSTSPDPDDFSGLEQ